MIDLPDEESRSQANESFRSHHAQEIYSLQEIIQMDRNSNRFNSKEAYIKLHSGADIDELDMPED